jgi:DNA polymerase III subunit gamma/tau
MFDIKYRPNRFSDVVGNASVVKLLLLKSKSGSLPNRSIMLSGPKGCGKTTLARIISRSILCQNKTDGESCGSCEYCESVNSDGLYFEEFDAATQGTVDRIRQLIQDTDFVQQTKIVIIDEAQRLTKASQDALLKPIEDRRLVVILCTTEPHAIRSAIRSRMDEYPIRPPSLSEIRGRISHICEAENIECDDDAIDVLIRFNEFCPRTCITSVELIGEFNRIDMDSVKDFFRYDSYERMNDLLGKIDSNMASVFEDVELLCVDNGPTWVRDTMVNMIMDSIRTSLGVKSKFPFTIDFYPLKNKTWCDIAVSLSSIDKPNFANIISVLSSYTKALSVEPVQHNVINSLPKKKTELVDKPVAPTHNKIEKSIEIDGVKFTSNESLTALDKTVEKSYKLSTKSQEDNVFNEEDFSDVVLDKTRVPMSERKFARVFVERFKKH